MFYQKLRHLAGYTVQKEAELSVSHRFFRCFPMCFAFRTVFAVFLPTLDFCTCQLRRPFVIISAPCRVGGMGMGGRVMTSMRMQILCCVPCVASYIGGDGGGMGGDRRV